MPRRISDYDWTKERLDRLKALGKEGLEAAPGTVYDEGPWTVLKLMAVQRAHDTYLRVLGSRREKAMIESLHAIEFNAGSGVVGLEETGVQVAGSALITAHTERHFQGLGKQPYDHYHYVEPDPERADALLRRLPHFLPSGNFSVYQRSANSAAIDIKRHLDEDRSHYMAVVDPYGFQQGDWGGYGRLMQNTPRGDFLINLQTTSVKRTTEDARRAFFGPGYPGDYLDRTEDEIVQSYRTDCLGGFRPVTEQVRVKAGGEWGRYYYDVIYAVAETRGGSPFVRSMTDLAQRVRGLDGATIRSMLTSRDLFSF